VGSLRTSEKDTVVAGEGRTDDRKDEQRQVDSAPKIIIDSGPLEVTLITRPGGAPPVPRSTATGTGPVPKQGSLALVIALYVLATVMLGYAIYERFH